MKRHYYGPTENSEHVSDLAVQAQQGDERAMEKLIVEVEPVMLALLRRYRLSDEVRADLLQEMRLRVFLDIGKYDRRRAAFGTWMVSRFRAVVRPFLAGEVGYGVADNTLLEGARLLNWMAVRYTETGVDGIDDDLMAFADDAFLGLNVTPKKVCEVLLAMALHKGYLCESDDSCVWQHLAANGRSNPEINVIEADVRMKVRDFLKYAELPGLQQKVMNLRYANGDDVPGFPEVAAELGKSREAVSEREYKARKALRSQLNKCGFELGDYIDCA